MHRTFMTASVVMVILWGANAEAQPITAIAEVAGKWSGVGSRGGKTDVELESNGKFTIGSPLGQATGMARIEGGILILPFSNNQGQIKFTRTGDVLEGPYVSGTLTGTTRVTRVGK